jgi:nitroimidazol reductase NimA-like FMN-containing flavoprotein (pyridoxamine 5'-phosphate oxidase superfamily)
METNKTREDLLGFLSKHYVATLATVKPDSSAHATTIYFHVDKDLNFYFLTRDMTTKFTNIKTHQHVALAITDAESLETVQVEGVAGEVDYTKTYADTVKEFVAKLNANGKSWEKIPLNHIADGYYVFVQIKPTSIKWVDFKEWGHTLQFEEKFTP